MLVNNLNGWKYQVGDRVRIEPNRGFHKTGEIIGTIFAFENNNVGHTVGVILESHNGRTISSDEGFAILRFGLPWGNFDKFVTEEGHLGKYYRWFPPNLVTIIEKASNKKTLRVLIEELNTDIISNG